jgi:hypothetical protein
MIEEAIRIGRWTRGYAVVPGIATDDDVAVAFAGREPSLRQVQRFALPTDEAVND